MNKLLYLLLFFSLSSIAQKQDCGWFGKMNPAERMKQFPFNKAKRIVLVSYPTNREIVAYEKTDSEYVRVDTIALNEKHYKKVYKVIEEKEITGSDVSLLSNTMINYKVSKVDHNGMVGGSLCYEPRNGVEFFDENDKIICFLEICFSCEGAFLSPENKSFNMLNYVDCKCSEHIAQLRLIFERNGVLYGLKKRE